MVQKTSRERPQWSRAQECQRILDVVSAFQSWETGLGARENKHVTLICQQWKGRDGRRSNFC